METVEQARFVVSAAKYGSSRGGTRSAPPFRLVTFLTDQAIDPSKGDIHANVNEQAAIMMQIETLKGTCAHLLNTILATKKHNVLTYVHVCVRCLGIENLDAILTEVPDIDIVWLGALDARVSMGFPGNFGFGEEAEWVAARTKFFQVIHKHDKPYGGFGLCVPPVGTIEVVREAAKRMSMICITSDVLHLGHLAKDLADARAVVEEEHSKA